MTKASASGFESVDMFAMWCTVVCDNAMARFGVKFWRGAGIPRGVGLACEDHARRNDI